MHVLTVWIDVILVVLAVCFLVVVSYPSVVSYIPVVTHPQASKVALVLFILIVSGVILRKAAQSSYLTTFNFVCRHQHYVQK